ncbi:FMN-binding negative transcriptional regulator [Luteimonas aestuarii]|uniref:FMN-binding negative transcriptional regulator n=1 Tax=Luteimonas aestuarii TaxID=453837 RepID=A0A4R5TQ69_9GAMM|nr:FMN-binding negative transcriptional regulator [Luteimonas aestuarii]TDK23454.1 FMN-binding negative transcriptional regulator [Luteimonas aestuarii]
MYLPRAFAGTDLALLDALVAADPFVTLVTTDAEGAPFASHLPVLYRREGDAVLIEGHWAKPNPQARQGDSALVIVQGPHHYISASWYPDKETAARVPTWNYATAHLHGTLQRFDDEAGLADIVSRLSDRFEASVGQGWRFEPQRDDHRAQLRGIVGFRFVPMRIDLKAKLSQNHPQANQVAVASALEALGDTNADAVAALMRQNTSPEPEQ